MGWMPYCAMVPLLTLAGLLNSRSVPVPVFGKAMTSRMDSVLQRMAIKRSKPTCSEVRSLSETTFWQTTLTEGETAVGRCPTAQGMQQVTE